MSVPDIVKGSTNEVPKTLGEAAANTTANVEAERGTFSGKLRKTVEGKKAITEIERRTQEIVRMGVGFLDEAAAVLRDKLGVSQEVINAHVTPVRQERDVSLYSEDYRMVAEFYRKFMELKKEADDKGMTDYEMKKECISFFMSKTAERAPLVAKHLKQEEVLDILDRDYSDSSDQLDADLQALKTNVVRDIEEDGDIGEEEKVAIQSSARNVIDVLKVLKTTIDVADKADLSETAVAGVIGRVLAQADMDKVFNNDFEPVKNLPDGSVRLVFADGEETFYHIAGHDDIPESIKKMTAGAMPRRVLLVHERSDEDVKKLLEDLSKGEQLCAKSRDGSRDVVLEGTSTAKVVVVGGVDGINDVELLAHPMKYLAHDVDVKIS